MDKEILVADLFPAFSSRLKNRFLVESTFWVRVIKEIKSLILASRAQCFGNLYIVKAVIHLV